MKYSDGNEVLLWDKLKLWDDVKGIVVCSLDTKEYSKEYTEEEWGYLQTGMLISTPQAGVIHYTEPESTWVLLERGKCG